MFPGALLHDPIAQVRRERPLTESFEKKSCKFGLQCTSIIPGRVLVTPGSVVVTPGSVLVTPGSVVVTPGSVLVTPGSVITTGSILVTP
ncbi:hypothetical protein Tco_1072354, partial [Tanacetum coccineum]